jgi:hypothetical protein
MPRSIAGGGQAVDDASVDQHPKPIGEHVVEASRVDRIVVGVGSGDLQVGREPQ